jgi:pyruvate formate lyase activating enzyme
VEGTPFLKLPIPTTFKDHPKTFSALFYTTIDKCNLNCYQCHNRFHYDGRRERFTEAELKEKLKGLKLLGVELLIVSGGEPLMEEQLEEGLKLLKEAGFPVRLDTNGTFPERLEKLLENGLIDGVALDVKVPLLDDYTPEQLLRFKRVLFSKTEVPDLAVYEYAKRVKMTIELIKRYSLPFTLLRTVRYPLLTEEDERLIKESVQSLPHQFNPFYPVEER